MAGPTTSDLADEIKHLSSEIKDLREIVNELREFRGQLRGMGIAAAAVSAIVLGLTTWTLSSVAGLNTKSVLVESQLGEVRTDLRTLQSRSALVESQLGEVKTEVRFLQARYRTTSAAFPPEDMIFEVKTSHDESADGIFAELQRRRKNLFPTPAPTATPGPNSAPPRSPAPAPSATPALAPTAPPAAPTP